MTSPHTNRRPRHARTPRFIGQNLFDDLTSFAELEARIAALSSEKERGDAFEVFAEAYLATQKIHQADEVWPENSAPIAVMQQLALPDTDKGVDGVLKLLDGALAAYQVKFRTGRPTLTWRDLSTFIGLADRVAHRILFTNCNEVADVLNERRDFICVRGADLDRLTRDDLDAIATWLRGDGYKPARKTPREHQQNALADLERGLVTNDRATAVMACGSGKTLVALWLAERMGVKRVLVLVPSLSLIRQTLHEWLRETRWDAPRFLACCSDPSVTSGVDDAVVVRPSDLDFPVTTDAQEVRAFLEPADGQVRVVFSTYQSAHVVGEAIKGLPSFELGVFDEAHKTAGRTDLKFAFALEDRNIPIGKRVFMTATPRHYDVRKKDKEGDSALVYSMDEPKTYGPIVHTLTFADAVRRGIICDCKIIISVVTSDMLDEELLRRGDVIVEGDAVRARTVANQVALQKACEAHDLKKVFTFHSTVKSAQEFTGEASSSVRAHLPGCDALHVNGAQPTARREKVMQAFREADRAVLSNARCLTEGIDVPAVDLVAFLSPKKSKVDIVQAAGRAMRKAEGKQTGYVLLPLFLETAKGESLEGALERTDFAEAWDVIQALREQDEVLADIIREMREERGRGGFDDARLRERIEVLGPQVSLHVIREAVSAQVVERFGTTWDERFGELVAFKEREGHCDVPTLGKSRHLARWLIKQRVMRKSGGLSYQRQERLSALGFSWEPRHDRWDENFAELKRYIARMGTPLISHRDPANLGLARWISKQRARRATMSERQRSQLDAIGFIWDQRDEHWERHYVALVNYQELHGNCRVPKDTPELGNWIAVQRNAHRKGTLSKAREERLSRVGFIWHTYELDWEERYNELISFRQRFGHCDVRVDWEENPELGRWVSTQRGGEKINKIAADRRQRLTEIGFIWDINDEVWRDNFGKLAKFKADYGHCNVPSTWTHDKKLKNFVIALRTRRKEGTLTDDQIAKLNDIGFNWSPDDTAWETHYATLQGFKARFGHCDVPWREGKLGRWVTQQKAKHRDGKLLPERKARLDALGFEWSRKD